jgi:hypothetical protein
MNRLLVFLLTTLLLLPHSVKAAENFHCPIDGASGDDLCIYARHIVFRETAPPKIRIKGKVVSLKASSGKELKGTKPFRGLPGYRREVVYEGENTRVTVVDSVISNGCYVTAETGKLEEVDSCCGHTIHKLVAVNHMGEEIRFTARVQRNGTYQ